MGKNVGIYCRIQIPLNDSWIIHWLYEDVDNLGCGIIEVIGNGNGE